MGRFSFRLRTLLAATAIGCVGLAFFVKPLVELRILRSTVTREGGGVVELRDPEKDGVVHLLRPRLWITFRDSGISDRALEALSRMPNIDMLDLQNSSPPVSWRWLHRIPEVRCLNIETGDDDIWQHLVHQRSLQSLSVSGRSIRGHGIDVLKALPQLRSLNLCYTSIGDEGASRIAGISQLRKLYLNGTSITDRGVEALAGLRHLRVLHMNETNVSQESVKHIARMTSLHDLAIVSEGFCSDNTAALAELRDLDLRKLMVSVLVLNSEGVPEVQQLFPGCALVARLECSRSFMGASFMTANMDSDDPFAALPLDKNNEAP